MKLFLKEYKYHVMNMNSGRFIFHTNDRNEADEKSKHYASTSGSPHIVLAAESIATPVKTITLESF
jgi:hypothetical protein